MNLVFEFLLGLAKGCILRTRFDINKVYSRVSRCGLIRVKRCQSAHRAS